ncbi:MAG: HD domain-containing protein [Oscillospiraceae bacterium]|nr:HD domain-containing protein [Oscillospiraceae bacterium]
MNLPEYAAVCIAALENAGFSAYAVGGCVRDMTLGLIPQDYDLCTSALPQQIQSVFQNQKLVLAGEKHGTVGVVTEGGVVEITTYRTEGDYRDHRHPNWVEFVDHIEGDLARRDFTVNAMAWSPIRGFADPFGGRQDLSDRILRAVGDPDQRFEEDALRILRGVRFAVRYGLEVEPATMDAMIRLSPLMDSLARERVFDELCKLLPLVTSEDLLHFAPILTQVIPELKETLGFDQHSPHHLYDIFTHTAIVTGGVPAVLSLRLAALFHDVGKVATFTLDETGRGHFLGHAEVSAEIADRILLRLKAPTALRKQVVFLIEKHMLHLTPEKKLLRRRLSQYGEENIRQLLLLQQADFGGKGILGDPPPFGQITAVLDEILAENTCLQVSDLAINGHDLLALGITGPAIRQTLEHLLSQVLDEKLPNEKTALLNALSK